MTEREFGEELVRLRPNLIRMAAVMASPPEAEDLVQDTLVLALRFRERFRGECKMIGWLGKILTNTVRDKVRRGRVRKFVSMEEESRDWEWCKDHRPNPEELMLAQDSRAHMARVMRITVNLTPPLKLGVRTYFTEQTAALTQCEKNQRRRAVLEIRRRLNIEVKAA